MAYVTFYNCDPALAPKPNMPTHLGANAIITCQGRLLLERRRDSDTWGLIGGGCKKWETTLQAIVRETWEELGLRLPPERFRKVGLFDNPGRIAAYRDGSVWRMVIVVYALELEEEPALRVSEESRELCFFTREEVRRLSIPVTHADIVQTLYLNR